MAPEKTFWPVPVPYFRLNADARDERHAVTERVERAIYAARGFIEDVHQFSNKSLVLSIEIARAHLPELFDALRATPLAFDAHADAVEESVRSSAPHLSDAERAETLHGTLQITFFHHEPDLAIEVPKVPG